MHGILVKVNPEKALFVLSSALRADFAANCKIWVQDEQLAKEHYPELKLETNNIEEVYKKISASHPHLLHPNLNKVTSRPWGAKEFAIKDNQIGIRFQQR